MENMAHNNNSKKQKKKTHCSHRNYNINGRLLYTSAILKFLLLQLLAGSFLKISKLKYHFMDDMSQRWLTLHKDMLLQ